MNRILNVLSIFAAGIVVIFSVSLLPGCKKQTVTTSTADSTTQTTNTATTTTAPSTTSPAATAGTNAPQMSAKALAGQTIFYSTSLGKLKVSCSSCHTDGQPITQDSRIRPGHTLVGVTSRTATWNGMFKGADLKKYAYGASLCAAAYENSADDADYAKALTPDQTDALNEYFAAIATANGGITKNITIQWPTKPAFRNEDNVDDKAATSAAKAIMQLPGDVTSGGALFAKTCQYCHSITDKKVGPPFTKAAKDINFAAKTMRVGSGMMVFYGKDILSDQQCSDILAYIQQQLGK